MFDLRPPRFEETPVIGASITDLNMRDVEEHLDYAIRVSRYTGEAREPIEFLLEHHAVRRIDDRMIPTVVGLLMFGIRPQRFLEHATISLAHYRNHIVHSNDVVHMHEYGGNVREQIDRVVAYLTDNMRHGYILEDGKAQREERPQYPAIALRELTVNAVAHRDYGITTSSVRVTMLRNAIEWASPGKLPPGVTIATILDHQVARNSSLLRLLFERGYVDRMGQGVDTVFSECQRLGLPMPGMRETEASFIIGITGHEFSATLTSTQQLMIEVLTEKSMPMKAEDIMNALHQRDHMLAKSLRSVQLDLKTLVELGLVSRVGQARATTYAIYSSVPRLL
jgi:ATP-dependent DNA helicase RecG